MSAPKLEEIIEPVSNSKQAHEELDSVDDEAVEHFLAGIRFFPTPHEIAEKILSLNHQFGEELVESQLAALPGEESDLKIEVSENEINENWLETIINRVSSILFHEEEPSEEKKLSQDELVVLFQKTVSEKIYDNLSLLSLSPHAKKGGTFSLTEELTKGIAEDVGLGLYYHEETREELRAEAEATLLELAVEFQNWLLGEWKGVYPASWGEIRARTEATSEQDGATGPIVWLEPDAAVRTSDYRQAAATEAV